MPKGIYKHKKGRPATSGGFKKGQASWNKGKYGEKHHSWQGGIRKTSKGYILIYKPEHPFSKNRYVFEHRLVMEKILGRYLERFEGVHHINGIKNDNRPENLMLFINSKNWHSKACPYCKKEFLIK